ncbi:ribosomal protein S6 kinase delta-1 isoform X2 [Ambystoma mexicanum]|uniref:ribosomal protein S6 kinase delta-1 isoform X2 n=1 Tax=Ambystoma mexicanum TaxID=8296 RepID=UPI0037E84194
MSGLLVAARQSAHLQIQPWCAFDIFIQLVKIVSRRNPDDVQEIVVWKRYSDFKKLHKELWQIHKNLYRHTDLFPPFAKAKVFGRFDESVIEERRQCAEDLLQYSVNIPALYNSKQFEDFFQGGEVHDGSDLIGPAETTSDSLTDSLSDCSTEVRKDASAFDDLTITSQSECGAFSSDSDLISSAVDADSLTELDDGMASNQSSPNKSCGLSPSPGPVIKASSTPQHEQRKTKFEKESRSLFSGSLKQRLGKPDYLEKAGELIKLAFKKEEEDDYEAAFGYYRKGVDLLLEGVQGESSPTRREAVKKKTAEYLLRAERISSICGKPLSEDGSVSGPPGAPSSRPSWNLRSPAEELKAFRVLGVIDKVLLVLDTRTQETFILKALRKSSEYSRSRKTIIPRGVPNMVSLLKYIISEESVFLVLRHAEGGKLWSYISKYLNRSPEESFEVHEARHLSSAEAYVKAATPSPKDTSSSIDSREGGSMLKVGPLRSSLTASSQDDSSTHEEVCIASAQKWVESQSSSEEECTTSYLTLCNEYGQDKIEPGSLKEQSVNKPGDRGMTVKDKTTLHQCSVDNGLSCHFISKDLMLFTEDPDTEGNVSSKISDSLSKSRNSPMELFRIDSKDSTSDLIGHDFGEKLNSLKPEPLEPFMTVSDRESSLSSIEATVEVMDFQCHDTISKGSNDSVPVISFKDAAFDDASSTDEGKPDLLVNLPGALEQSGVEKVCQPNMCPKIDIVVLESRLLETPDVLQLNHSLELGETPEAFVRSVIPDPNPFSSNELFNTAKRYSVTDDATGTMFNSPLARTVPVNMDSEGKVLQTHSAPPAFSAADKEESLCSSSHASDSKESTTVADTELMGEDHFLFSDRDNQLSQEEPANTFQFKAKGEDTTSACGSERAQEAEKEIHQIFQDLDKRLALTSQFCIPEDCIQRWAAEIVLALDALHREGIVCRDLNPNNILLNDRGHIQLTYFSRWSDVEDAWDKDAMERMYCAPEIGAITEETEACDWWSVGAVLFELLTGKALVDCHPSGINTHTFLCMPEYVSDEARSLVQQLLQFNPLERLGAGVGGVEDIKSHPFFAGVNWTELPR